MDAIILGLLPVLAFGVGALVLIVHLRNQDEGARYQHEEYRPPDDGAGGGSGNGCGGNGHGPPGGRRRE